MRTATVKEYMKKKDPVELLNPINIMLFDISTCEFDRLIAMGGAKE